MNWNRAFILAVAALMVAAGPPAEKNKTSDSADADRRLNLTLVVQAAMQQGRECLRRGEYPSAVRALEAQLAKVNGDPTYLALLEDAYRGLIRELKSKGEEALAQRYVERLAILDPGVVLTTAVQPKSPPSLLPGKEPAPAAKGTKTEPAIVRGRRDDDPGVSGKALAAEAADKTAANDALGAAEKEFQSKRYREAVRHYLQAYQKDRNLPDAVKQRWSYCILYDVTEQINHPSAGGPNWTNLETEVRSALSLSPQMEYGKTLLKEIQRRSQAASKGATARRTPVQHLAEKRRGWQVAESDNFRAFHQQPALAEQILQKAEETRVAVNAKWFADDAPEAWRTKCDIYVHANGDAYSRETGAPPSSPGHSSIEADPNDASRVVSRRIDLHMGEANLVRAVLPHETTHAVIAGQFGARSLPRWVDEGMAVLSEPDDRIEKHFRGLPAVYQEGRVFSAERLMRYSNPESHDYPPPHMMQAFYGQSVALVKYLSELRGPRTFVAFVRDANNQGYETAIRRHYGITNLADLDRQWSQQVIASARRGATTARANSE